jgi:hypothetical protein
MFSALEEQTKACEGPARGVDSISLRRELIRQFFQTTANKCMFRYQIAPTNEAIGGESGTVNPAGFAMRIGFAIVNEAIRNVGTTAGGSYITGASFTLFFRPI